MVWIQFSPKVLESQLKRNILAYVDDIVIISAARRDHISDLAETFANIWKANLSLNPEKCVFGVLLTLLKAPIYVPQAHRSW